jgi:hypothetical protein
MELRTLELAASLRPSMLPGATSATLRRGRQPGSISRRWREILATAALNFPAGATPAEVVPIAQKFGLRNIRARDVQRQMEHFSRYDYVALDPSGKWALTTIGSQKFIACIW